MTESFYNKNEQDRQRKIQERYDRNKKLRISDLRKVLSIPEGRRTIWSILTKAKVFADAFSPNALEMAKNEGERSVGINLLSDILEAESKSFYQMYAEEMSRIKAEKKEETHE